MTRKLEKVVLMYSGGLDTSVAIPWLREKYGCEVVAFLADVGQDEDLEAARAKGLRIGASKAHVLDLRKKFVEEYVFPAIRAQAVYEGQYLLGTSLARPCIVEGLMKVVAEEKASAVAHGATGKGNDQVRFDLGVYHFAPNLQIIAPWREWEFKGRSELIGYLKDRKIEVEASAEKPYSVDRNLLHTSYEGGILEDPWAAAPPEIFQRTADPQKAPDAKRFVEIEIVEGTPVAVDGKRLGPVELLTELNRIGGENGVGRVDVVENRFVGMKSRGVYETPGGTLLHLAQRAVESLTLDREVMRIRDDLIPRYAGLVYNGFWFSPERETLQRLIDDVARGVTGTARLELYRGAARIVGRKSPRSLYRADVSTFEADQVYDQRDATGFIKLNALRLRIRAQLEGRG